MKQFIQKILFFLVTFYLFGELGIRIFDLNVIPPLFYQDMSNGLVKYYPNQELNYTNGNKYFIGANGNTGQQTKINNNGPTVSVIGDSYIEAFMNPNNCHQSILLQKKTSSINFTSRAISGATFIQMLEMTKDLEQREKISHHLIYVQTGDFIESLSDFKKDGFSYNLSKKNIIKPVVNIKLAHRKYYMAKYFPLVYYIYRKTLYLKKGDVKEDKVVSSNNSIQKIPVEQINNLFKDIKTKYEFNRITLVLMPNTDKRIDGILANHEINFIRLFSKDYSKWRYSYDHHWNCHGHQMAADQVYEYLKIMEKIK